MDGAIGQVWSAALNISHPVTLRELTWFLPKSAYPLEPRIVRGAASVTAQRLHWRIKAERGARLEFTAGSRAD